ncbi:MAG TPA: hypothetical protein VGN72_14705 [Tepidisphaeraceae bacterium]|jgi:hypothetical protein|nr:hypothetical protein [Tepidisphaeraceae bacterium]
MFRSLGKTLVLFTLTVAAGIGIVAYVQHDSTATKLREAERQNAQLQQFVERLTDEKRVANVIVTDVTMIDGVPHTTLLFVEFDKTGRELPPKRFTVQGNGAHIDAMVIKFDRDFVKENDPLRGHSIVLFHRLFGEHQTPADGFRIDEPGSIPAIYQDADPKVTTFERDLWDSFWRLTTDESLRVSKGVRVANPESVWGPFEPNRLYTITLEADGGLNRTSEPLKSIYREALNDRKPQ